MAGTPDEKRLQRDVDRLNQQVCTLMAYISHLEQSQRIGIEERFLEAAAKKLLSEFGQSDEEIDHIHNTATYLARGKAETAIRA